jgi:hypothetical protein
MANLELRFLLPPDNREIVVELDDTMTPRDVLKELLVAHAIDPNPHGYTFALKGGDVLNDDTEFRALNLSAGAVIRVIPATVAGGGPYELPRHPSDDALPEREIRRSEPAELDAGFAESTWPTADIERQLREGEKRLQEAASRQRTEYEGDERAVQEKAASAELEEIVRRLQEQLSPSEAEGDWQTVHDLDAEQDDKKSRSGGRTVMAKSIEHVRPFARAAHGKEFSIEDAIEFGVSFPTSTGPTASFVVDAWIFQRDDRQNALDRAMEKSDVNVASAGAALISRGTMVTVTLRVPSCSVRPRSQVVMWDGRITNVGFVVSTPDRLPPANLVGTCSFCVHGLRIGSVPFEIPPAGMVGGRQVVRSTQISTAFASYASKDRRRVLARVQGIEKLSIKVFMDVRDLRANDPYPSMLLEHINASDVLYLFWSRHASRSQWVEREWRYAMEHKGLTFIDPVPLVDPRKVSPPAELAENKHFNDWTLAYLEYEKSLSIWDRLRALVAGD